MDGHEQLFRRSAVLPAAKAIAAGLLKRKVSGATFARRFPCREWKPQVRMRQPDTNTFKQLRHNTGLESPFSRRMAVLEGENAPVLPQTAGFQPDSGPLPVETGRFGSDSALISGKIARFQPESGPVFVRTGRFQGPSGLKSPKTARFELPVAPVSPPTAPSRPVPTLPKHDRP